jgi:hypothetical protein
MHCSGHHQDEEEEEQEHKVLNKSEKRVQNP